MPFFEESLEADAAEFAERLIARFPDAASDGSALGVVLKPLTTSPTVAEFQSAADMFRQVAMTDEVDQQVWALRCTFYAASSGCLENALRIAAEAVSMAADDEDAQDDALELYKQGSGWLHFASVSLPTCARRTRRRTWHGSNEIRDAVEMRGNDIVDAIAEQHRDFRNGTECARDLCRQLKLTQGHRLTELASRTSLRDLAASSEAVAFPADA